jgi:PAS domain S-box-containing protein
LDGSRITPGAGETAAFARSTQIRKLIARYLRALLFLLAPVALTFLLRSHPDLYPLISLAFVIAVSAAAWWYGAWAGILVSFVSVPALTLVATSGQAFLPQHVDLLGLGMLCFISVLVSRVANNRKRIETVLRSANEQLETRVKERTAELQQANTAIREANAALLESEQKFRAMADSAPVMIWTSNTLKSFTWFNRPWLDFTGLTIEAQTAEGWAAGIHPDDRQRSLETYVKAFDTRTQFALEYRRKRHDGVWRWVLSHGVAHYGGAGDFLGYIGSCIDIHDRKEMEEHLRRANSDLQQFAYSASHDLQEPIRTIAIYGQLLKKRYGAKLDETGETFLEYLTTAAQRMENLVQDLLSYTRAGDTQPSIAETDANCDLKIVLESLAAAAAESHAAITSDPLPVVDIDSIHLQQLLQNLISNAIKYRGDEPPRIHISAREQNTYWRFSVQDNGIGIDPAYKERIFGIFKRLHTNDKYSGTGIGLAICQRIVERYRGRIWVESEPGSGSIFYFTIPRRFS